MEEIFLHKVGKNGYELRIVVVHGLQRARMELGYVRGVILFDSFLS